MAPGLAADGLNCIATDCFVDVGVDRTPDRPRGRSPRRADRAVTRSTRREGTFRGTFDQGRPARLIGLKIGKHWLCSQSRAIQSLVRKPDLQGIYREIWRFWARLWANRLAAARIFNALSVGCVAIPCSYENREFESREQGKLTGNQETVAG